MPHGCAAVGSGPACRRFGGRGPCVGLRCMAAATACRTGGASAMAPEMRFINFGAGIADQRRAVRAAGHMPAAIDSAGVGVSEREMAGASC